MAFYVFMEEIMKKFHRYISLTLAIIICLALLCSCSGSRAIPAGKLALTPVGTVGEREVLYEEYYFLANTYLESAKQSFEGSEDELREHVEQLVAKNIVTNHAILTLCEAEGVEYDKSDMKDAVNESIEEMITTDFGNRETYIKALEESYMTDHYVRFVTEVDLIYSILPLTLAQNGKVSTNEDFIRQHVKENFARTWHVMIPVGDDADATLSRAESELKKLMNGDTSMYELIGSALNKDVAMPYDGYCFAKGTMDTVYEDAAFSLEVGEYSDVVLAKGETGTGEYVDCYYIIQRLAIDDAYINDNYDTLTEEYSNSVIYQELSKIKNGLEFVPNDFAKGLDLLSLEAPVAGFDWLPVIIIGICVIVIGGTAVTVTLVIKSKKKKLAARIIKK